MIIKNFVIGRLATNTYLVRDEVNNKCFIVDPAEPSDKLKAEIISSGATPEYIILTHGHGDHTGGIDDLKKAFPGIRLVACKKERKFLYNRSQSFGSGGIVADIEVSDNDTLTVGNIKLTFIETPGHTPGGMCIYTNGVLFSGDTLFHTSVGRTDFPGGSYQDLITSIKEKLFVLPDDTRVLPGHDTETLISYEKRYNPFV